MSTQIISMNTVGLRTVNIGKNYPKGALEAFAKMDFGNRSKQCSLHSHDPDIAYETIDLWAEDFAKENNVPYIKTSKAVLLGRIGQAKSVTRAGSPEIRKSILGNKLYFKAEIKKAFEAHAADKIREVMKEGLKLLNELERDRIRVVKNSSKAKADVARAMYLTFVDTGVDTSIYCTDETILNEFKKLQLENEQGEINV